MEFVWKDSPKTRRKLCLPQNFNARNLGEITVFFAVINHMKSISTGLDQFSTTWDNLILIVDFDLEPKEDNMSDFQDVFNVKILVKQKTCLRMLTILHA